MLECLEYFGCEEGWVKGEGNLQTNLATTTGVSEVYVGDVAAALYEWADEGGGEGCFF